MTTPADLLGKTVWLRAKDVAVGSVSTWQNRVGARESLSAVSAIGVDAQTPAGGRAVTFGTSSSAGVVLPNNVGFGAAGVSTSAPNAVDGNAGTYWSFSAGQSLYLTPESPLVATSYVIDWTGGATASWTLEGSADDGQTWVMLDTRASVSMTGSAQTFTFANAVPYSSFRLTITAYSGGYNRIDEVSVTGASHTFNGDVWLVARLDVDAAATRGLWSLTGSSQVAPSSAITEAAGRAAAVTYTPTVPVKDTWRLFRISSGGTWTAYIDGAVQHTDTATPQWDAYSPKANVSNGHLAEVVAFNRILSDGEAADLIAYFNTEHGLSVPVPSVTPTGALGATGPSPAVALAGSVAAPTYPATIDATSPAPSVSLSGTAVEPGAVSGTLVGVGPAPTAAISGGSGPAPGVSLEPWTADLSRRTRLVLRTSGSVDALPALELPPAGFVERPIMRKSVTVPALTVMADVAGGQAVTAPDYAALEDSAVVEEVGVPHIVFPNVGDINDVTYFRGGITRILRDRREEPFGDVSMTLELPQITSMDDEPDTSGSHPLAWTMNRANAEIVLRKSDGTITRGVWSGHVVSHDTGNDGDSTTKTLTCQGSMWQAATDVHKVPNMLDPTDIGTLIPKALNQVASRRYPRVPNVRTGIMSKQRGSWSDSPMAYAQGLLATAHTEAGRQWTISKVEGTRRTYQMRLKKTSPSWTVTNGARGVDVSLTRDATVVRNVIYGHGVGADGYAWWNYHYPNLRMDDAPAYPYSSAGTVMSVGSTDAGTVSGDGVSDWQRRARDLGYNVTVNGVFSSDDATAARAIQRRYGLTVDGVVGPQTWAATFDVGGNGGDLDGAIRLPLAADPRTQRWLYNADGSMAGENPAYDPNVIIYAADVDFGAGVSREEGIKSAQQIVDRESTPGLTGRITLHTDPREGSRILIPPGDKITLVGYEGADRVLHITAVERDWQNLTVTLEVDEKSRDAMTLAQIRERNRDARRDPARRPGNVNRRSRLDVDQVVPFDGESGAGWIPKHAIYGGLWTVIRVPVSELGRVAKLDIRTSGPASRFAVAMFGAPIQPAHLVKYVGNPLTSDNPYESNAELLQDRFGFIEGWGQSGQAAGYWPGQEGDALTGRLVDAGGFEYVSAKPPWVWVAEFSESSTFISGRILPAPIQ